MRVNVVPYVVDLPCRDDVMFRELPYVKHRCLIPPTWKLFLVLLLVLTEALLVLFFTPSFLTTVKGVVRPCQLNVSRELPAPRFSDTDNDYDYSQYSLEEPLDKLPHGYHARRRLPHFIIAGVKKAGTRALLTFLNIHPDIVIAPHELHFFDVNDSYAKGQKYYRKLMPYSYADQLVGEKTPSYFREHFVPERIHTMNSSIKIIIIVREPIYRAMSNYLQHILEKEDPESFEQALFTTTGEINLKSPHISNSDYNRYVDNWLQWFPLEQLLFVDGDRLQRDPVAVMKDVQQFLGIQQYIAKEHFKYDEDKGFFCYYNVSHNLTCLGKSKGRSHPPIQAETRRKLHDYFEPRNRLFFQKINQTFLWDT